MRLVDFGDNEVQHGAATEVVVGQPAALFATFDKQRTAKAARQVFKDQDALVMAFKDAGVGGGVESVRGQWCTGRGWESELAEKRLVDNDRHHPGTH